MLTPRTPAEIRQGLVREYHAAYDELVRDGAASAPHHEQALAYVIGRNNRPISDVARLNDIIDAAGPPLSTGLLEWLIAASIDDLAARLDYPELTPDVEAAVQEELQERIERGARA